MRFESVVIPYVGNDQVFPTSTTPSSSSNFVATVSSVYPLSGGDLMLEKAERANTFLKLKKLAPKTFTTNKKPA